MHIPHTNGTQPCVLVIEDDTVLGQALERALNARGFNSIWRQDGLNAVHLVQEHNPTLVLLDLILPELGGFEVLRQLRASYQLPIIVISGRSSNEDKMYAFDLGADDYVTKPFNIGELVARIRAVLRRSAQIVSNVDTDQVQHGDLQINFPARRVWRQGREIKMTPIEFNLLKVLSLNSGRVVTHQALLSQVWGAEYGEEREYLRVHLSHLRHKIEPDPVNPRYIQTVPRVGYRFTGDEQTNTASQSNQPPQATQSAKAAETHDRV